MGELNICGKILVGLFMFCLFFSLRIMACSDKYSEYHQISLFIMSFPVIITILVSIGIVLDSKGYGYYASWIWNLFEEETITTKHFFCNKQKLS